MSVILYSFQAVAAFTYRIPLIFIAVIICGVGYTYGASLAKNVGGMMPVCLANGSLFPFVFTFCLCTQFPDFLNAPKESLYSLFYLGLMSQLIGFFPFYTGLSKIGVAKGVQIQLLQPFVTLLISSMIVGSPLGIPDVMIRLVVMACV